MERFSNISMAVVRRLPKYHRYLRELLNNGIGRVSSQELSRITGFTASQIRQDLNCFGGFGQQGYGYNVEELYQELGNILGLNRTYKTIIIGAGNVGRAIANYTFFEESGFKLYGMFDNSPKKIGDIVKGHKVLPIEQVENFIKENGIEIGILCTPKEGTQKIAETLVNCNITAIWNFAPVDLKLEGNVIIENVHLSESLFTISFLLKEREDMKK
ncbi:MAG TPA: redox-sensing transcriptional repressor Rex [Bacillota bacterium]|nr:redox-sensing transcriptional repressor Rex [Bacillota bacterium]HOR86510.1 redox-sensing transcriptional repressor Rex [Bacillota bacterium]